MSDAVVAQRPTMSDLLNIQPRALRAVEIAKDYSDPDAGRGYIATDYLRGVFDRLLAGLRPGSTQRAWRLTGDYGSGKSSFGLVLARLAAGDREIGIEVPHDDTIARLAPVLIAGQREPLARSLLKALDITLARELAHPPKGLVRRVRTTVETDGAAIVDLVAAVAEAVRAASPFQGLLLLFDELGKNLEYASRSAETNDLHLLQQLGEAAERSGEHPFMVVGFLHQSVGAYAGDLAAVDRKEWDKVSGRLQDVTFAPPLAQSVSLVSAALGLDQARLPRTLSTRSVQIMRSAAASGWYGAGAPTDALLALAPGLAVLDPYVLPVLSRVLRRFGQNERSLFSFLTSVEPHGLISHAGQYLDLFEPYRLHNLFDYLASNLSTALESGPYATRWGIIQSLLETAPVETALERQALKTVGLLNLLDDPGYSLDADRLAEALVGTDEAMTPQARGAIERLRTGSRLLYDRGAGGGLCVWPHTSVDIDAEFQTAVRSSELGANVVSALKSVLGDEPLVARRHYIETGALRHFEVNYVGDGELPRALAEPIDQARCDGRIVIALPLTEAEHKAALELVDGFRGWTDTLLVGVPQPVEPISPLLRDLKAWQIVRDLPSLAGDPYARREVARQLALAEDRLRRALSAYLDVRGGGAVTTRWTHRGQTLDIRSGRALTEQLSSLCDNAFKYAPKIRNELINRRQLSSAAARARSLLIEGLSQAADKPQLGLDSTHTPPEMSIYLSVLRPGGVHVERDGLWSVQIPPPGEDDLNLRPALTRIGSVLKGANDGRVPFEELQAALRPMPYGVRDGVSPLLIAIYLAVNWHHTAVYEDGTYLEQVGGPEFARMLKEPEHFTVQHCAVEGVRAEVFVRLAVALGLKAQADEPVLLDIVRPLMQFIARLPDHARRTQKVSAAAASVRAVLLRVTDPSALLFEDLPRACGLDPLKTAGELQEDQLEGFLTTVSSAVRELRDAYPALIARTAEAVGLALDAGEALKDVRPVVSARAARLERSVVEPELRAFLLRLNDAALMDTAWLESLGSFLARKPPERWTDADERDGLHRLKILARRFRRVEETVLEEERRLTTEPGRTAYQLVLTGANGAENRAFVMGSDARAEALETEFAKLLDTHGPDGMIAAARALASALIRQDQAAGLQEDES